MSVFGQIPLPGPNAFLDEFMRAHDAGQALIQDPMKNALIADRLQQQNAIAKYAMSNADLDNQLAQNKVTQSGIDTKNYPLLSQLKIEQQRLANQGQTYKNQMTAAEIPFASQIAQAKALGSSGLGVGGKEQMFLQNLVSADNPQLQNNPQKLAEATNAIMGGQDQLSDGTKLNVTPRIQGSVGRLVKYASDADARKRSRFATNIDKSFDQIDLDALTKFGGAKGQLEYNKQRGIDATTANASDDYYKFQDALQKSTILADQIRQFYGTSIQPSIRAELQELTNPATWMQSPRTAKVKFNSMRKLLQAEEQTMRQSISEPADSYQTDDEMISSPTTSNKNKSDPLGIR